MRLPTVVVLAAGLILAPAVPAQPTESPEENAAPPASVSESPTPLGTEVAATPADETAAKGAEVPAPAPADSPPVPELAKQADDAGHGGATAPSPEAAPTVTPPPVLEQPTPVTASAAALQAMELRSEELAARVAVMQELLLAQRDREMDVFRDAHRLVMYAAIAFGLIGLVALVLAAIVILRGLSAAQKTGWPAMAAMGATYLPPAGSSPARMDRVQASGQRFKTQMGSLEDRLAELEDLAARDEVHAPGGKPADPEMVDAHLSPGPAPMPRPPEAAILVHKARAQMNLGQLNEAMSTLDEAETIDRANPELYLARGQVLEKLGRLADALDAYDHAVENDTANTTALLMKAGVLNRQDRFADALACYERALQVHRATAA